MPGSTQPVESLSAVHDLHSVIEMHAQGQCEVSETIALAVKLARADTHNAWIYVLSDAELKPMLERLDDRRDEGLPLYGVPFAIKDNIDLAGICTTAGCPEFAYVPKENAYVVDALIDAGAIPIGKTNLDQFATGLVGVRSPYGEIQNAIDREWLAGGSSSGSAVAVALGQVCFSLGTDTAGARSLQQYLRTQTDRGLAQYARRGTGMPQPGLRLDFQSHPGRSGRYTRSSRCVRSKGSFCSRASHRASASTTRRGLPLRGARSTTTRLHSG